VPESKNQEQSGGLSLRWLIAAVFALLIFVLWGFACAMFDVAEGNRWVPEGVATRGAAVRAFVSNAIEYIPSLPQVVSFVFRERLWYVFVITAVLGAATLFAIVLKRVQRHLDEPPRKGARSGSRK
jgi:hypothetical protein